MSPIRRMLPARPDGTRPPQGSYNAGNAAAATTASAAPPGPAMGVPVQLAFVGPVAVLMLLFSLSRAAHADLRLVQDVSARIGATVTHRRVTLSFQKDRARIEIEGGPIYLLDFKAAHAFRMDPARQSYGVLTLEQALMPSTRSEDVRQKLSETGKPSVRVDVHPENGGSLAVIATVHEPPVQGVGSLGGPRPIRIAEAVGEENNTVHRETPLRYDVRGEYQVASDDDSADNVLLVCAALSLPDDPRLAPLLTPLVKALLERSWGIIQSSRIQVDSVYESGMTTVPVVRQTVLVSVDTRSVSRARLDRSLFYVPAGYRLEGMRPSERRSTRSVTRRRGGRPYQVKVAAASPGRV